MAEEQLGVVAGPGPASSEIGRETMDLLLVPLGAKSETPLARRYAIFGLKIPESDVDIMGSVIPSLTSPFAIKAYPVLAACAFFQQLKNGSVKKL